MEAGARSDFAVERQRVRRRVMITVLIAVVAFMPLDLISGAEQTLPLTLSRVLFLLTYGAGIWLLPRLPERQVRVMLLAISVATSLALTLMCAGTGGSGSPAFSFLWALPLAMGLLFLDQPWASLLCGVFTTGGALFLLSGEGRSAAVTAYWVMVTAVSTLISTTATALYRRVQRIEVRLERQRAEALERVARHERERAVTERLVVLGRLAAGVAHEVNNPLAFVRGNLSHLKTTLGDGEVPEPGELSELVDESLSGVDRIAAIMQDLRSYARRPTEEPETVEVASLVDEALRFTRERLGGFAVKLELAPELPPVFVNRGRVVQVLINLLTNAADALESAAAQGRPRAGLHVTVRAQRAEAQVRLDVDDTGVGLAPELEGRLFEPFVTTKAPGKGAGIGLALSYELAQRQGGTLSGGNRPEGGARFTVTLPVASGSGDDTAAAAAL